MRPLYVLLVYLVAPLVIAHEAWKALFNPAYRGRLGQRLGFVQRAARPGSVWIHAVSVGEVQAAAGLVSQLQRRYPDAADRAHHGHAYRLAAGEVAVQRGRAELLPAVRPAGVRWPFPGPDFTAGGGHPRDRDLADPVRRARTAADSAAARQRARLDAVGRSLPAHGHAVPRHAVARHPDRCADAS